LQLYNGSEKATRDDIFMFGIGSIFFIFDNGWVCAGGRPKAEAAAEKKAREIKGAWERRIWEVPCV
jgi:hypothetical protein